jgi:hypothetical protein
VADDLVFARNTDSALSAHFLTRVRTLLRLPPQAQLQLSGIHDDPAGGSSVEYGVTIPVQLHGAEYGIADGVTVDEQTSASLSFDAAGKLISSRLDGISERHLQLVRDQVKKLAASDQIASTQPEANKPWYLEKDTQGVTRLKRAHMT